MVVCMPAVDVDTASSQGCVIVTTPVNYVCLVIIDRAENVPVRKVSQQFLF